MSDTAPTASQGFPPANPDGTPALIGPDDYTKKVRLDRINTNNTTVLTGNYADIQRIGADAAVEGSTSVGKSIPAPPGVDPKSDKVKTPAQHEADRGEFTRETERTGLLEAPPAADPPDNDEPNPIDPGSVSPRVDVKGGVSGAVSGTSTPSTSTSASTSATKK